MSEPRDEFDGLRDAWQQLRLPEDLAPDASSDPETQACMDWMNDAWGSLETPLVEDLPEHTLHPVRAAASLRRRVLRHVLPFAAAASALFLWQVRQEGPAPELAPQRSLEVAIADPEPERTVIRPRVLGDGSIEMRSGNVRLILLPESTNEPSAPTGSSEEPAATPIMETSR